MITHLPPGLFNRLCAVPRSVALRELDREILRLSCPAQGNAQIVPFRTRGKKTVQDWPMPPMGGAA